MTNCQHTFTAVLFLFLAVYSSTAFAKYKRNGGQNFPPKPPLPSMSTAAESMQPEDAASGAMGMMPAPPSPNMGGGKPVVKVNGTALVDKVMTAVRAQLIKMDLQVIHPPDLEFDEQDCKVGLYEGKIVGVTNFRRVGDVITLSEPFSTKFRSAFGFSNVSYETGMELVCANSSFDDASMKMSCDNATLLQVYKLDHVNQILSLDEFEVSLGECRNEVWGLGNDTEKASGISNKALEKGKPILLQVFNVSFKLAVNFGLQGARMMAAG